MLSSMQALLMEQIQFNISNGEKEEAASEKFHGAVVDHCGHENTRVFREVTEVGEVLKKINEINWYNVEPEVAIIFDWENRWAIDDAKLLKK